MEEQNDLPRLLKVLLDLNWIKWNSFKFKRESEFESYTTFMTKGLKYHILGDKAGNIM